MSPPVIHVHSSQCHDIIASPVVSLDEPYYQSKCTPQSDKPRRLAYWDAPGRKSRANTHVDSARVYHRLRLHRTATRQMQI